ncbi:cytochrome c biogenesis protein ResB [Bdellovibrio reynosensis]|uniref:Cytochrome c biogenesis protein ResB n=1 Tax=Bdellovibrio reynosensis TaxID=2835041 RepID=A0ABY4CEW9_9BACT|nr:cytochrome c biogenesis protein ResB [Bdellovibrio reynosensis]UOF02321.1 cytochrome c biogenesis protein ResB [Bdellovibrio reynosensis]
MNKASAPQKNLIKTLNKPLASLKLAVFIIISLAVITAVGTFVEAKYDAYAAKKLVYDTWYMYAIMGLLVINLTAVMLDRWPWKKRHASFVLAHIGIIILLAGAYITAHHGLDGSMRVGIGESNNLVQVPETDLTVYTSFDGDRYSKTLEQEVDFFKKPPSSEKPFVVPTYEGQIKIVDYKKYVLPSRKVVPGEEGKAGAGVRFQLQNPNVNVVEWLVQKKPNALASQNFGPAQIFLGSAPIKGRGKNEIFLTPDKEGLQYVVFQKDSEKPLKKGFVKEGDVFDPGFKMALSFRVLRYLPAALEEWDLKDSDAPTPLTTSAIKIIFENKEHWVLLNDMVKLFTNNSVYLLTYGNRRIDIGFPIKLHKFEVARYQGTMRAAAYQSLVEVPKAGEHLISMNEPLKHNGLTIYQASFQEEQGQPVASIFSINHDPGRFLKYLGSLVISLGIVLLMWFKHLDFKVGKSRKHDGDNA